MKWSLVFFIKSSISNVERRKAIRNTWGSIKFYNSVLIKQIFIVGSSQDKALQQKLNEEIEKHQDILQLDLKDSSK